MIEDVYERVIYTSCNERSDLDVIIYIITIDIADINSCYFSSRKYSGGCRYNYIWRCHSMYSDNSIYHEENYQKEKKVGALYRVSSFFRVNYMSYYEDKSYLLRRKLK